MFARACVGVVLGVYLYGCVRVCLCVRVCACVWEGGLDVGA